MNILQTLLNFSERASKIARVIRQEPRLFALLVEEKNDLEKNNRFAQDFKTLADVLIQESLRHYVTLEFPNLSNHVKGEENSTFTNTLGEKICVRVNNSQAETASLLSKVLDGNFEVAGLLADLVHGTIDPVKIEDDVKSRIPPICYENIGIWIDPIDSTGEYVHGLDGVAHPNSLIFSRGIQCVTVLLGIYNRMTGRPIAGVINQPFSKKDTNGRWCSSVVWGIDNNDVKVCCPSLTDYCNSSKVSEGVSKPFLVVSGSESAVLLNALSMNFELVRATGAGYKSLAVILSQAEAYFCSKGSTYRWDTCGPHGVLLALGGGIISYKDFLHLGENKLLLPNDLIDAQILYHGDSVKESSDSERMWCNFDGVVAYRNSDILPKLYDSIRKVI